MHSLVLLVLYKPTEAGATSMYKSSMHNLVLAGWCYPYV
jgi:hypothetical protein